MSTMVHEDEILGKAYDARLMRRLLTYLRPYKRQVALAFVLILFTAVAELAPPYLTKLAIDTAIVPNRMDLLPPIIGAFIGSLAAAFVFRYAQNYVMQMIGQNVMYDLRLQIVSH